MQVSPKNIIFLIELASLIFLIAPVFLISYIVLYNSRKRKHAEEKERIKQALEKELLKTQMEVQEQTLQNIAYNLHDNIGQLLSLTAVTLGSINIDDRDRLPDKIAAAESLTRRSIKEVRQLSRVLQGQELLKKGLASAVEFELEWVKISGRYKIDFINSNYIPLEGQHEKEMMMFRLFQEILNNILRHANATEITIQLTQKENLLSLSIQDNGQGFDVDEMLKKQKGMGLHNIQKRASMIEGNALFNSAPGKGTVITIVIPYC